MRPSRSRTARVALALVAGLAVGAGPLHGTTWATPATSLAPLLTASAPAAPGAYVVVLRPGSDPQRLVRGLALRARHVYDGGLTGFAAGLTPAQLDRVRRDPAVELVEPDQVVRADGRQEVDELYGLDRVDQRALPLSGTFTTHIGAGGVKAYVVDSGIDTGHPDFGGRARNVHDATGGDGDDCYGHGTHVAGILGGETYGVAKSVRLRGVRVLGCDGTGLTSDLVDAVQWVTEHAVHPAVANLSLTAGYSPALNRAVAQLSSSGVLVAVAAGNASADACESSPASAGAAVTVAATDRRDARPEFSSYGSCVDLYAPGVDITSTWLDGGTRTVSGTSMASPAVAGVAALYKATYGDTPSAELAAWLRSTASSGKVRNSVPGTPNRLLFTGGL